jgi:predicted outer membrane repeat protein
MGLVRPQVACRREGLMLHICASIVATLTLIGTSFAATINVPGDHATIAAAISASVNGDVIAIAAGTYYEHSLNPNGKAITIEGTSTGNGSLVTTIDAQGGGSVFVMDSGEDAGTIIKHLVVTGGSSDFTGGGINCSNSSPTITGCLISNNYAEFYGGGIYCNDSNPTITDCTISSNTADELGGGILYNHSSPTIIIITDCTISGNEAIDGGGIVCSINTSATFTDCNISTNTPNSIDCAAVTIVTTPTATAACCLDGPCITATESDCTTAGGTWLGEGGLCEDCPAPCIADIVVNDQVDIHDLMYLLKQWGPCP